MVHEQMQTRADPAAAIKACWTGAHGHALPRYRAHQLDRDVVKVGPGDVYVGSGSEIIRTTLGSCITVCMFAPSLGVGGMNHFMLAGDGGPRSLDSARYGLGAMQRLQAFMMACGASRKELQLKLFGGAAMLGESGRTGVDNLAFLRGHIAAQGLNVVAEDVGGDCVRQVLFYAGTGQVRLHRSRADALESESW